jgi:hypothetical protein
MIFIGYEPGSKAYRVYNPATRCVHVSRDVVFNESASWDWSEHEAEAASGGKEFVVEYTTLATPSSPAMESMGESSSTAGYTTPPSHASPTSTSSGSPPPAVEFATPP